MILSFHRELVASEQCSKDSEVGFVTIEVGSSFKQYAVDKFEEGEEELYDSRVEDFFRELKSEYHLDIPDGFKGLTFETSDQVHFTFLGKSTVGISWICGSCTMSRHTVSNSLWQIGKDMAAKCVIGQCHIRFPMWDEREYSF